MSAFDPAWYNTIDQVYHYGWSARKLLRIRLLRRSIAGFWPGGHPSRLVHVAGTNGKGSVCRMLQAALADHGGCLAWVNPHLFDWGERFRLPQGLAPREHIVRIWEERVLPHSLDRAEANTEHALTFAEAGILIALHLAADHGLPFAVFETGVGGRYAPTMAIDPALCLLSNVGRDHPLTLGSSPWQVALEKAGIARPGVPFLSMEDGEAEVFVRRTAVELKARYKGLGEKDREQVAQLLGKTSEPKRRHWFSNAALALEGARALVPDLDPGKALEAMRKMPPLEGRFAEMRPGVVVDVAHNADKLAALAADLRAAFPGERFRFLLGISRQRKAAEIFAPLFELALEIVLTEASYAGQDPLGVRRELQDAGLACPLRVLADPAEALNRLEGEKGARIVISGSAYTVDQALNPDPFLKQLNREFGRRGNSPELGTDQSASERKS